MIERHIEESDQNSMNDEVEPPFFLYFFLSFIFPSFLPLDHFVIRQEVDSSGLEDPVNRLTDQGYSSNVFLNAFHHDYNLGRSRINYLMILK